MNVSPEMALTGNLSFVERLYGDFLRDPGSVEPEWRQYFEGMRNGESLKAPRLEPSFKPRGLFAASNGSVSANTNVPTAPVEGSEAARIITLQNRVNRLVRNYRVRGHNIAALDPLGLPRPVPRELELGYFGFSDEDLDRLVSPEPLRAEGPMTVRQIYEHLRDTYCRSIGVQYMHIDNFDIRRWLQDRMERSRNRLQLSREEQIRIFSRLTDAVAFEEFIRRKFVGAKSFSLEGCESLIPLLDLAIEKASAQGIREIVFGMAHRGRLNVLANIVGKSPRQIFREFVDDPKLFRGHGDVKYHLGYSNEWTSVSGRKVHLSLCFNPSHLEFVNPVAAGRVRAKMDRFAAQHKLEAKNGAPPAAGECLCLLIHGDASFAGQGVVQETLNMSQLPGYSVGGTVHVVVNNQIGFTTPPEEARSSMYSTDVGKLLQIPIFHVNGEDPEAVAQVVRLAIDFRETFHRDVIIDMYGYRRLGHNEGDEPSFTQPTLYKAIERRKNVREGYLDHLLKLGGLSREEADEIARRRHEALEQELSQAQAETFKPVDEKPVGAWVRGHYAAGPEKEADDPITGVKVERLSELLLAQTQLPADFRPHSKIKKFLEGRVKMAAGEHPLDWAAAEALALASLSVEGFRIRLSGQDSRRGTFSQRHAALYDYETGEPYIPLQHLGGGPVDIFNSPLSEAGVLGFDYGYSLDCPDGLVMWEAQFGDFVNGAQVIIDQFIASAEDKWNRWSGITMLLPHGFEGQGPEHSSARLERFLALAAQDNIQIINATTPAQYFHCLRRQMVRKWRKPLIMFTPKSLLREPRAASTLAECAEGRFQRIIPDTQTEPKKVRRILMCSGKIYYELQAQREALRRDDVAIIRLEQLYPLAEQAVIEALAPYAAGVPVMWVQEEPENMGAWSFVHARLHRLLRDRYQLHHVSRAESASPATGSAALHQMEQADLLDRAIG